MKVQKTFSFTEETDKLLSLLCMETNVKNSSEVLRSLVVEKSIELGIIKANDTRFEDVPSLEICVTDTAKEVGKLGADIEKLYDKLTDIEQLCHQIQEETGYRPFPFKSGSLV